MDASDKQLYPTHTVTYENPAHARIFKIIRPNFKGLLRRQFGSENI
jgi:hypothetical protein